MLDWPCEQNTDPLLMWLSNGKSNCIPDLTFLRYSSIHPDVHVHDCAHAHAILCTCTFTFTCSRTAYMYMFIVVSLFMFKFMFMFISVVHPCVRVLVMSSSVHMHGNMFTFIFYGQGHGHGRDHGFRRVHGHGSVEFNIYKNLRCRNFHYLVRVQYCNNKKLSMPEPTRSRTRRSSPAFLDRYETMTMDAAMPMPTVVFSMPVPA